MADTMAEATSTRVLDGSVTAPCVPCPASLVTAILPPLRSIFRLAIAIPSPVPVTFVEK